MVSLRQAGGNNCGLAVALAVGAVLLFTADLLSPRWAAGTEGSILGAYVLIAPEAAPYPADWRVRGFEGVVDVDVAIDSAGNVTSARVNRPGTADTDSAAVRTARKWKFQYARDERGFPRTQELTLPIRFRHPRSPNLVWTQWRHSSAIGTTLDYQGRAVNIAVSIECSTVVDSVTGEYEYHYKVTNDGRSQAPLLYFAVFPIQFETCTQITSHGAEHGWGGFQSCDEHTDVAGWMAVDHDPAKDSAKRALLPGESLIDLNFKSFDPPDRGRWVAGGGVGCGPACFPWAAACSLSGTLSGIASTPKANAVGFRGDLMTEIIGPGIGGIPGAKLEVLGTGLSVEPEANGSIRLPNVPIGKFRVRVTATGFVPYEDWIDMGPIYTYMKLIRMVQVGPPGSGRTE